MVSWSWDYHLNLKKKLAGLPIYYTRSNEPSHAPEFEWSDSTFKESQKGLIYRLQIQNTAMLKIFDFWTCFSFL